MRTTLKITLISLMMLVFTSPVFAVGNHNVRWYVKKDGKYVKPHRQTNPNKTQRDNWSAKDSTNFTTGKKGTKKASH